MREQHKRRAESAAAAPVEAAMTDEQRSEQTAAPSDLTPYFAAKVATAVVAQRFGEDSRVFATQTMYGMAKSGAIKARCDSGTSGHKGHAKCEHVVMDGTDFKRWLDGYKQQGKQAKTVDALIAEYSA